MSDDGNRLIGADSSGRRVARCGSSRTPEVEVEPADPSGPAVRPDQAEGLDEGRVELAHLAQQLAPTAVLLVAAQQGRRPVLVGDPAGRRRRGGPAP